MSADFEDKPYSDSHLDSPEYRRRLMRKLNTLIAVLEVACAKVRRSLSGPDPDTERLNRIHKNLKDTLSVCLRARKALERCERLPDDLPKSLGQAGEHAAVHDRPGKQKAAGSSSYERSSSERDKFTKLGPLDPKEIRTCDLDELCRQLLD